MCHVHLCLIMKEVCQAIVHKLLPIYIRTVKIIFHNALALFMLDTTQLFVKATVHNSSGRETIGEKGPATKPNAKFQP